MNNMAWNVLLAILLAAMLTGLWLLAIQQGHRAYHQAVNQAPDEIVRSQFVREYSSSVE